MLVCCRIPGRLNDRRTPLGELNWIFTAITDTIAWNVLPRGELSLPSKHQEEEQDGCKGSFYLLLLLQPV